MGPKKVKSKSSSSNSSSPGKKKKLMIYAIVGIAIVAIVTSFAIIINNDFNMQDTDTGTINGNATTSELVSDSQRQSIAKFVTQFCGSDSQANSNDYVTEYVLPERCEMPLGIAVNTYDDNNSNSGTVWYISTKNGTLGRFDIDAGKFSNELLIPSWPSKENPISSSQVWDIEIEAMNNNNSSKNASNIWFTDEKQNAIWKYSDVSKTFEIYYVPEKSEAFGTTYPVSLDLDPASDKVYFVGIRSPSIWIGNMSKMKNGTSEGIEKIDIPIDAFRGITDPELISTGSIALDKKNDALWISLLAFNTKGQIFRYDLQNQTFRTYDLPSDIRSPVGLAIGYSGGVNNNNNESYVWGTDHATSIFFRLDPSTGQFTKFATSQSSPRIHNLNPNIALENTYTLPYWIKSSNSNSSSVWFNEHTGNKIAKFEPENNTLVEYWIPTQNALWGRCPEDKGNSSQCGIANALQFDVDIGEDGNKEVWFTEWSENKIGRILAEKPLPFSVAVSSPQSREIAVDRGDTANIQLNLEANMDNISNLEMLSSGSFSPSGAIVNATGIFSEQTVSLQDEGDSKQVSFFFSPQEDLKPGNYTLMLGAETESVSVLKGLKVEVI